MATTNPHSTQKISPQCSRSFDIDIVNAPPLHSSSNGQVERFHSTLAEIARCLKLDKKTNDTVELILRATVEYNKTVHSVTRERPIEVIHSGTHERCLNIKARLVKAQQDNIERCNPTRQNHIFEE